MESNKKKGFFSWFTSKIKKKKITDYTPERTKKNNNDIHKKTSLSQPLLQEQKHCSEKKEKLNDIDDLNNINSVKENFFSRLTRNLKKTKKFLGDSINKIFLSKKIDEHLFEELEEIMLLADIGINTTNRIINNLIKETNHENLKDSKKLYLSLQKHMFSILHKVERPLQISTNYMPFIILVVGVNGTGKTTTVAKLAKKYQLEGKSIMLAAADTFRAAGIEQLKTLGTLNKIPVISKNSGSDPAAVIFDAVKSAKSKKIDVLIIDTAGRLHNKSHLMEELKKIVRVIKKIDISAPHETMLIIDACNGQNTIQQTKIFHQELNLTGIVITKLDGTAKGGVIFSLADQFNIPIRYIGIGEKIQDLGIFNSKEFICAIFNNKKNIIK